MASGLGPQEDPLQLVVAGSSWSGGNGPATGPRPQGRSPAGRTRRGIVGPAFGPAGGAAGHEVARVRGRVPRRRRSGRRSPVASAPVTIRSPRFGVFAAKVDGRALVLEARAGGLDLPVAAAYRSLRRQPEDHPNEAIDRVIRHFWFGTIELNRRISRRIMSHPRPRPSMYPFVAISTLVAGRTSALS